MLVFGRPETDFLFLIYSFNCSAVHLLSFIVGHELT
jgi:hypothetical protein